jgi:hypothetical protein
MPHTAHPDGQQPHDRRTVRLDGRTDSQLKSVESSKMSDEPCMRAYQTPTTLPARSLR